METTTKPNEIRFSLFLSPKGIKETIPTSTLDLKQLRAFIRHDDCMRLSVAVANADFENYDFLKRQLPFITPNGIFEKRGKEHILSFNSTLLPIDVDHVGHDKAPYLRNYLAQQPGCIYSSVSPSQKGVKAMFLLSQELPWDDYSDLLKYNQTTIEETLGIDHFDVKCDPAQWNKGHTMFIPWDDHFYFNTYPEPINILLKEPIKKHVSNSINIDIHSEGNIRVCRYFENAINNTYQSIIDCKKGHRHEGIGKVMKIASIIHYAPHLQGYAKEKLRHACLFIYPENEWEASRCFENAWDTAEPRDNNTLNEILNHGK